MQARPDRPPDDLVVDRQLGEADRQHEEDAGPQEPVPGRRVVDGVGDLELTEPHEVRVLLRDREAVGGARVDEGGAYDAPGHDGAEEERQCGVEAHERWARTDEGGVHSISQPQIHDVDRRVPVVAPGVEPPEDVLQKRS